MKENLYYRWVLINNQETCYTKVVKLLDGFFPDEESVKDYYSDDYCFEEYLFSVRPVDFSETPEWLAEKISEFTYKIGKENGEN